MLLGFGTAVRVLIGKVNKNIATAHIIPEKAMKLEDNFFFLNPSIVEL